MQIVAVLLALPLVAAAQAPDTIILPGPTREMRAVWVATVNNLDWPTRPGLPVAEQQRELLAIMDRAAALKMNAIVLQVRPEADALYASRYEPWSRYLTGTQGKSPGWDPLKFAVVEAHKRGLELHAWLNPYRVAFDRRQPRSRTHVSRARPDLVVEYGPFLWMNPGLREVRQRMIRVLTDIVRRYDVDGVHIDDYFYPYPETTRDGRPIPFPDARTYRAFRRGGGQLSLGDWRRRNVDNLVREMYETVKREKRGVLVGISPFGIWRPGVPVTTTAGVDQYNELFADARKWLREGWLDYIAPQLYWPIRPAEQSYPVLLRWWVDESVKQRHVWPGLALYKLPLTGPSAFTADEIVQQIRVTRETAGATGHIHFNARVLMDNVQGIADRLAEVYADPSLPPASTWLDKTPPPEPSARIANEPGAASVQFAPRDQQRIMWWVVQARVGGTWRTSILPGDARSRILKGEESAADLVAVTAVDRAGNLSEPAILPRR